MTEDHKLGALVFKALLQEYEEFVTKLPLEKQKKLLAKLKAKNAPTSAQLALQAIKITKLESTGPDPADTDVCPVCGLERQLHGAGKMPGYVFHDHGDITCAELADD